MKTIWKAALTALSLGGAVALSGCAYDGDYYGGGVSVGYGGYYGGYRPYYRPALYGGYRVARRVAIHRARWR